MQDVVAFYRQRAVACFHRRRRCQFLSPEWWQEVTDARMFIGYYRAEYQRRTPEERLAFVDGIIHTVFALGPEVRAQKLITRPARGAAANEQLE